LHAFKLAIHNSKTFKQLGEKRERFQQIRNGHLDDYVFSDDLAQAAARIYLDPGKNKGSKFKHVRFDILVDGELQTHIFTAEKGEGFTRAEIIATDQEIKANSSDVINNGIVRFCLYDEPIETLKVGFTYLSADEIISKADVEEPLAFELVRAFNKSGSLNNQQAIIYYNGLIYPKCKNDEIFLKSATPTKPDDPVSYHK
jgi:hypothetical protein